PLGRPLLLLHGGPGSGCSPTLRRPFDLGRWRLICPDQRGSGRSQPGGETRANTTAHLLADLRQLRRALGIERWCVVGGSWGATLALLHALDEPHAVDALLLRAVFLARDEDVAAFFDGAHDLARACGAQSGEPLAVALGRCFAGNDEPAQRAAVLAWWAWEQRQQRGAEDPPPAAAALTALTTPTALPALPAGPADPAAALRRCSIASAACPVAGPPTCQ
ncbi:MAG TPA: alpha/beta fold hydrolase, partial [Burkholderiaceae bacterium]|nr:alpha/beta fold hydrolase [Burkholderiaceae bacterium]